MITQYSNSYGYSSVDTNAREVIANKISVLDKYVLMQTGENEYTALVKNTMTKKTILYKVTRNSSNYNSYMTLTSSENADFDYTISNEMYVYSNVGKGRALDLPVNQGLQTHSLVIITCVILFAIVFKGVLFRCIDKIRRK